jgi:hypothetical protein
MARYDWPREFRKSPDRLVHRAEHSARSGGRGVIAALTGDLDLLDDVIQANLQDDRMWMPLGPSILINGQASGNPMVSGRVRDIRISPNGQRVYVGTANGGVWYSPDVGTTWTPLGGWALAPQAVRSGLSLTIGALLVEFGETGGSDDPAKDVVYVGTGEAQPQVQRGPGGHHGGIGILRLKTTLPAALTASGRNPWTREARNLTGAGIYRLARDPAVTPALNGSATLVAATSTGLWSRTGPFAEDADWQRVEFAPQGFSTYANAYCSDVVWNDRGLWVTLVGSGAAGHDGVYRSTHGLAGPFTRITLANLQAGARLSLGEAPHATTRMYVLGKRPSPTNPANNTGHAHLWQIDVSAAVASVREIQNFPVGLFVSEVKLTGGNLVITESDQSDYDQAIAVRQVGTNDVVTVGGSLESNGAWDAALFDLTITTVAGNLTTNFSVANQTSPATDAATFIGAGIHPDVHIVRNAAGAAQWVGCDGGVFRRSGGTNRSLNAGLASAEPGIIASHPTLDGPVLAGTQDNGAIQRIGDTLWRLQRKGDGGGCLFHPTKPHQTIMQYVNASWRFQPSTFTPRGPAVRSAPGSETNSENTESERSLFYSKAAAARSNNDNDARIFIGTDRVWYSANWNAPATAMNWVTIPTHSDPYNASNALNNISQDRLLQGGNSDAVNVIEIVREGDVARKYDGMAILVLCARTIRLFRYAHPDQTAAVGTWTTLADSIVSDPSGVDRPKTKKTGDDVPNPFLDYLPRKHNSAWTDIAVHTRTNGSETFYVTTTGQVTIAADGTLSGDQHYDTCWWYNGAGRWYPTGLRNAPLNAATGTGGSPAAAHAVVVDPDDDRIVYVGNRIGVWQGQIDTSGTHPSWSWKPAMEGLPQTVVEDLGVFKTTDATYLRAALVSRGVWERDISALPVSVGRTFIRSLPYDTGRVELPATPKDALSNAVLNYHSSPDIVPLPVAARSWAPGLPNEADLYSVTIPPSFAKALHEAYVMVHHRHTTPVAGADIDINVFLQKNAPAGDIGGVAINDAWRTAIRETVRGNAPAMPAGLAHLGVFHPAEPVDARTPRAVNLPLDLRFAGSNDHVMLIAIVTSPNDLLPTTDLAHGNLKDIVRRSAHIAVRKFHRTT